MPANPDQMARVYLTLWKLIDIQFPEHKFMEICPESQSEILNELQEFLSGDMSWADDPKKLRKEIQSTIALVQKADLKDREWRLSADAIRHDYRDRALKYADDIQLFRSATH